MKRRANTELSLGILWSEDDSEGDEDVDGFTLYGFWPEEGVEQPRFSVDAWPPGTEVQPWKFFGQHYTSWLVDVRVRQWPPASAWFVLLRSGLQQMIDAGAWVAWCATDYVEPPKLLSEEYGFFTWAGLTRDGDFFCRAQIGEAFETLPPEAMKKLHGYIPEKCRAL